ncbi:flagellar hook-basal body complex protein [Iodidimonas sp. SYSU 1G8]|uniref:flagellar hook-basal body complex protein n=1 Tax=Iodidimonas sp. SYSU 1G8 TaxID=3133967 RepID=UPI0031FEA1C3
MDISSYVLLSQEQALRRRLDVVSNNLANSGTVGFKREQAVFHEYVETSPDAVVEDARNTSFVLDYGTVQDLTQGGFQSTGNALDVMIEGPGYLSVEGPDGTPLYTRAGFVRVLSTGELGTAGGQRLLGEGDQPISIPPDQVNQISVGADGTVMGPQGSLGRLTVTRFANDGGLEERGNGLLAGTGGTVLPAEETRLKAGGVEGSNVQPVAETTAMVEILRSYQNSARMSQDLGDMRQRAIDRLGRVN